MHGAMTLLTICSLILCHSAMARNKERKLITFNTALQDSIPLKEERRQALQKVLKDSNADVVCLQEVFDSSDIEWLRSSLLVTFPYSFSFMHLKVGVLKNSKRPPCKDPEITEFLTCMSSSCSQYNTSVKEERIAALGCVQKHCGRQVFSLSQDCLTCFLLRKDFNEARDVCFLNSKMSMNVPGLLLFSKHKMLNASAVEYHPGVKEVVKRGYLQAYIRNTGTVVCTHLSTNYLGDLYPEAFLSYGSYLAQNRAEVDKLLTALKDTTPLVLAGDFNTSPDIPQSNVCAKFPDSYEALTSNAANLFHTAIDKCTFCNGNTWVQRDCGRTVDHIFLRGHTLLCITSNVNTIIQDYTQTDFKVRISTLTRESPLYVISSRKNILNCNMLVVDKHH